ncbi:MAG: 3-methyl-2-oxobutanoate hydroxymethyltransferase [Defluviitaleaceae bacterium]|nr:3-methyl-2-oxobutanoate hydroxymethyltransferase [Defluviitaleaceae bacterium]
MKTKSSFQKMKGAKEPIVMVTAYDYPTAQLVEEAGVDMILVGDSLGMVVLGYDSTTPVTVADMIHHGKAVRRGAKETFIVLDMPFMSYHLSKEETMRTAMQMMQGTGANALKLEGADEVVETIAALTKGGIPVVAHLGLTPQSVGVLGGYKVQGKDEESAKQLVEDALAVQHAGAIALVLECVPQQLATYISQALTIPTIGIGAGVQCDGQVLVFHDLVGYKSSEWVPSFVKKYSNVGGTISESVKAYTTEVRERRFPTEAHSFHLKDDQLRSLYGGKS